MRSIGPGTVALAVSAPVWFLCGAADGLDTLYPLNLALRASIYAFLFLGAAAGAFAAVETGVNRRQPAARLMEAGATRAPAVVTLRRLLPVICWFTVTTGIVVCAASLYARGDVPYGQVAVVAVATMAAVGFTIGVGALAGRFLPFGLGPLVGALSSYALYLPVVLSGGRGLGAVVPLMDLHPSPLYEVRLGAVLLGAGLLAAVALLLVGMSGARMSSPLLAPFPVAAAVLCSVPLWGRVPFGQEAVFLVRNDAGSVCAQQNGARVCVLAVDSRFMDSLRQGTAEAWPVLEKYGVAPQRIGQPASFGLQSTGTIDVAAPNLASGATAVAGAIMDGAVDDHCTVPLVDPATSIPWSIAVGAVLRHEAGLSPGDAGGETARQLLSLAPSEREALVRKIIAAIKTCQAEPL